MGQPAWIHPGGLFLAYETQYREGKTVGYRSKKSLRRKAEALKWTLGFTG